MPFKASAPATDLREIDRWDGGVGWLAHPEEGMRRASHALAVDGDVWIVDPVDADGVDDLVADFGAVAGVVLLLDRHRRDCAAVARRHDVAVHLPRWMDGVAPKLDAPVEYLADDLPGSGYAVRRVIDNRLWQEAALYHEGDGTLVVPEAVGTTPYFLAPGERLGVHPVLRLTPPRALQDVSPSRVLVGHGAGVSEDAAAALRTAIRGSRRRAPRLYAGILRGLLP